MPMGKPVAAKISVGVAPPLQRDEARRQWLAQDTGEHRRARPLIGLFESPVFRHGDRVLWWCPSHTFLLPVVHCTSKKGLFSVVIENFSEIICCIYDFINLLFYVVINGLVVMVSPGDIA